MGVGGASEKYRLGERIGGGGMAEVFEAVLVGAEGFARPVAVKRMIPTLSIDPAFGQMFVNEARIASLLHHANIGAVLDFDRDAEGRYFIVMELIRGLDLRRLADGGRLPVGSAVHIVTEMLRGLDYAHELEHEGRRLGVVHRDISPHNVMLSWDGAVKVVDFGIAKVLAATGVSRTGTIKGKLAYMSPEQAGAAELDGRSDLFSVGVVLHELLTGQRLFRGQTEPEVLARLLTQPIPRPSEIAPDVPAELDRVVMWLLERDREARAPSAHDALDALLGTSAASTRGALELQRVLTERFPDKAPKRRGGSSAASQSGSGGATPSPVTPATPTAITQISPVEATVPQTPAARAARTQVAAAAPTLTARPAAAVEAPAAAVPSRPAGRRRPWMAGAVVAAVAAAVTAG
ncbi:MAG TPA: serine/threonine-protein kinase, partial [Kofleriaceae bacterium]|nr:serine/threonine-protein kinase [Kofleriaceae bacterium]